MTFVSMNELVDDAFREGYAVPAFCTWNAETMDIVLSVAERLRSPVIVSHGPLEFPVLCPQTMATVARSVASLHSASAALHLDHGNSLKMVEECIEAGYTSVMLDLSSRPFDENAETLRRVVELARPHRVTVEGEIGKVGYAEGGGLEGAPGSAFTDPDEAARYAEISGVDLLAVSVGNKHGFYKGDPHLEFGLLEQIHKRVGVPLVLHGGTGIPEKDIRRAVGLGISKVNVGSEFVHGFRTSLTSQWEKGVNLWSPLAVAETRQVLENVVEKWIATTGAAGKA